MKKNAFVIGCNSERGKVICDLINSSDDLEFTKGIGYDNRNMPLIAVSSILTKPSDLKLYESCIAKKDVFIDVSDSETTMSVLQFAFKYAIPMVIAHDDFTLGQKACIKGASRRIPVFMLNDVAIKSNISIAFDAARFIMQQAEPGIYTMDDLFNE